MNPKELDIFINSVLVHTKTTKSREELIKALRSICPEDNVKKIDKDYAEEKDD